MKNIKPIQLLYHGTSYDYSEQIELNGLKPVNYDKVYLTTDINVAYQYAKQRIQHMQSNSFLPVICVVDAVQMYKDGFVFDHEQSSAEWTTDNVPPHYLVQIVIESDNDLELLAHYAQEQVCDENC